MPVNGLPPVLECLINKLLDDSKLASYKIVGLEQRTTIVLRFGPPDMGVSAVHHSTPSASFRRKSPSQMRRDEIRKQHYMLRPQHLREARGQNNTIGHALEKSTDMTMDNTESVAGMEETDNVEVMNVQHTTTTRPSDKTNQQPEDNIDRLACKHTCPSTTHNTHDRSNDQKESTDITQFNTREDSDRRSRTSKAGNKEIAKERCTPHWLSDKIQGQSQDRQFHDRSEYSNREHKQPADNEILPTSNESGEKLNKDLHYSHSRQFYEEGRAIFLDKSLERTYAKIKSWNLPSTKHWKLENVLE